MNTLITFIAVPPLMLLFAFVVAIPLTLIDVWDEWDEKRKLRKQYNKEIKLWKKMAMEESDPIEKGYKVARLCNLAYEKSKI